MNQTEAWETVCGAAFALLKAAMMSGHGLTATEQRDLAKACKLVHPRVQRMSARLDTVRARRAGTPRRPKWATP